MRNFTLFIVLFATMSTAYAQRFTQSVGVRTGVVSGIFFNREEDNLTTRRYMLSARNSGMQLTVMKYKQLYKLDELPEDFSFYYGFGGHVGYMRWSESVSQPEVGYYWRERIAPLIGIDGLIGISYDLRRMPISITLDTKPFIDVWGRNTFSPVLFDVGLGVVYTF
jgi:hypothetical protein